MPRNDIFIPSEICNELYPKKCRKLYLRNNKITIIFLMIFILNGVGIYNRATGGIMKKPTYQELQNRVKKLERMEDRHNRTKQELKIVTKILEVFLTVPDDQMYAKVLQIILDSFDSQYGVFGYFDANKTLIIPSITREIFWDKCNIPDKEILFKRGDFGGIWKKAVTQKEILISNNGPFKTPDGHIPITNTLVAPIVYRNKVISTIHIANKSSRYNRRDIQLMDTLSRHIAPVLNARLERNKGEKDRIRIEGSLKQEKSKAQIYLDISGVIFLAMDKKGTVTLINRKGCDILGYPEEDILGKNWFDNFIPERLRAEVKPIAEKLLAGILGSTEYYENPVLTKEKEERIIAWNNTILRNEAGEIIGLLSSGMDITERKRMEEQLQIRQRMDSLGTLAGGIAHDFNNILTGIIGSLEEFCANHEHLSLSKNHSIRNALKGCDQAAQLIGQFQTLTGESTSELSNIDIYDVVSEVLGFLSPKTGRHIEKRIGFQKGQFYIKGNSLDLKRVFTSLATNACRAIEAKKDILWPDYIAIEAEEYVVIENDEKGLPDGNYIHIIFMDSGIGMSEEVKSRAFDPFFSTKSRSTQKGQGLGLAMAYTIITGTHNGNIEIESEEGKGTRFHIYLPKGELEEIIDNEEIMELARGNETILIVDDEPLVLSLAQEILENEGYSVLIAPDGETALQMYSSFQDLIGVVILDLTMPKMSGKMVFKKLLEMNDDIKVIISTGHAEEYFEEEILARAKGFLKKPYRLHDITAAVRTVLDS